MKVFNIKGFTLVEGVVVIGILIILSVIGINVATNFGKDSSVKASARTLASALDEARSKTLASENLSQYGVHLEFGDSLVTLYKGETYSSMNPENEVFSLDSRVIILSTTLGLPADVLFTRLSGTSTPITAVVAYENDTSTSKSVTVQGTGLIIVSP